MDTSKKLLMLTRFNVENTILTGHKHNSNLTCVVFCWAPKALNGDDDVAKAEGAWDVGVPNSDGVWGAAAAIKYKNIMKKIEIIQFPQER